jgi:hypothetical protein
MQMQFSLDLTSSYVVPVDTTCGGFVAAADSRRKISILKVARIKDHHTIMQSRE